jgi:hypothetical protein
MKIPKALNGRDTLFTAGKQTNKKNQISKKLVERYGISVSQITTDMFHLS